MWGPLRTETNRGLAVNLQDLITRALDLDFIRSEGQTTLTADAGVGDQVINVTDATGIVAGKTIGLSSGTTNFYFGQVLSVDALAVTLDTPIDVAFPSASAVVDVGDRRLNVNGSAGSPIIFQVGPRASTVVMDIVRIMGLFTDATAMDDGKFGGLDALINGVFLRLNNGVMSNYWNVKSNGDLSLLSFDTMYTDKAPAGQFGYRFRNSYAGQDKHGVIIRLGLGETLELVVQDDLTGLLDFRMMAQGHVFEN